VGEVFRAIVLARLCGKLNEPRQWLTLVLSLSGSL
jgi:hypothetical protein